MPYASKEARRESHRRWYARNKERVKEWKKNNPQYQKEWAEKNADRIQAYRIKHRENYKERGLKRYIKLGLRISEGLELDARKIHGCVFCGEKSPLHIDHVIPRSRGGDNSLSNLQWLCATCNSAKGALTTDEFITHLKKILSRIQ